MLQTVIYGNIKATDIYYEFNAVIAMNQKSIESGIDTDISAENGLHFIRNYVLY